MNRREQIVEDKKVTLTVNECSEFHNLGESHENIETVAEEQFKSLGEFRQNECIG